MLFLNQQKRKNGRRNIFLTKSSRKDVPDARIYHGHPKVATSLLALNQYTKAMVHVVAKRTGSYFMILKG